MPTNHGHISIDVVILIGVAVLYLIKYRRHKWSSVLLGVILGILLQTTPIGKALADAILGILASATQPLTTAF